MKTKAIPLEVTAFGYLVLYLPYFVLVRWLALTPAPELGRPLSGLEILPATQILSGVVTLIFVWAAGWARSAHQVELGGISLPVPTRWTTLSGLCTALVLVTVPLSVTFTGVSIPFIQLLMRGDVLVLAPLVDIVAGRKVRWYSWIALLLVLIGVGVTVRARGGFHLPPLAITTIVLYSVGYFGRLAIMTKVAKTGAPNEVRQFFVEEKLVGIPGAILLLAAIPYLGLGAQGNELQFGFIDVWHSAQLGWLAGLSLLLFAVSVVAAYILLDKRENTFCVPMERSASILAGVGAAFVLAWAFHKPAPTGAELIGAALLVVAVVLLSLGPRLGRQKLEAAAEEP
jgi:drug/metabolite transporter (DMT)-like permease